MAELGIGMDLSTTHAALVVLRSGDLAPVAATTMKRSRIATMPEAVWQMAEAVRDFTKEHQVAWAALEDVYVQRGRRPNDPRPPQNPGVVLELARLGGVVEYLMWRRGVRVVRLGVAEWCKLTLGKNTAKAARGLALYKRYGVELKDEHQVDAYGVAMAYMIRREGRVDGAGAAPAAARRPSARAQQASFEL
jgi:Holliday junction resolvasome RuvABC endonuclease subunit